MVSPSIADNGLNQADNDNIAGAQTALPESTPLRPRSKFRVTWYGDISEDDVIKEYVIDGVFGAGEFTYVVGKPGCGKSVIIGDMACHVGAGMDWNGRKVKRGLVVFIAAERAGLTRRRLRAFRQKYNVSEVALAIVEGTPDLTAGLIDANELCRIVQDLAEECELPPVWVIIDTLSRSFGGADQHKAQDMAKFVLSSVTITKETGAHVTVIHHTPWGEERAKGAIDLDGAVDASFIVKKTVKGHTMRCDGANDGGEGHIATFTLESVTLGVDGEGRPTTAPVVVLDSAVAEEQLEDGAVVKFKQKAEKKADRIFKAALAEVGQIGPNGTRGIHQTDLKIRMSEAFNSPRMQSTSLPTVVRRELTNLVKWGTADRIGDWFYPAQTTDIPSERTRL